jgi:MYXO-CTERM domain-containing protein
MNLRLTALFLSVLLTLGFTYEQAGDLIPGSGNGQPTSPLHIVDMRFPIEEAPAYPNSQVYRPGGQYGGGGGQCDASNYDYPWRDNYCEYRSRYTMPLCPDGVGHQGQDIRPGTCEDSKHWAVATENGRISVVGTYSVYLQGDSGVRHRFLHMDRNTVTVSVGQRVTRGQRLGKVSNDFDGVPTTIHLHYDMYKFVSGLGSVYVSPYTTLVDSYEALLGYSGIENPGQGCTPAPVTGAEGNRFEDVVTGSTGESHIYALADAGVTSGCAPDLFCPDCDVERYQMAVFIARAASLDISSPPATPSFDDVDATKWYYPHVEAVRAAGIVSGCNGGASFCPNDSLTRAEAAKFVVLGAGLELLNPATASCSDVAPTDWSYRYVETAKEYCITTNCDSGGAYNPDTVVSRRIAAIFIARAFDLDNLNTCVSYCDPATCDDASGCADFEECGGFADVCDETGQRSRECQDFACQGTYTNGTCTAQGRTETESCTRDTDGVVASGYTSWSACDIATVYPDCGGEGTQTRTREVCGSGVAVPESDQRACSVETIDASLLSSYQETWYADADGDGYGDIEDTGTVYCADPGDGSVRNNLDCDDAEGDGATISPGATELCDGVDNDCDGTVDNADPDEVAVSTWYADVDGDGYGDPESRLVRCDPPEGYVSDNTDCDDTSPATAPGESEVCDGVDNDCDGVVDPDCEDEEGDSGGNGTGACEDSEDPNCGEVEEQPGGCACGVTSTSPTGGLLVGSLGLLLVGGRRRR